MFDILRSLLGLEKKPVEKKENDVFHEDKFVMETEKVSEKNDAESLDELTEKYFPKQETEVEEPEPKYEFEEQEEEQVDEKEEEQGYVTDMPEHNLDDSDELNGQLNNNDQEDDKQ